MQGKHQNKGGTLAVFIAVGKERDILTMVTKFPLFEEEEFIAGEEYIEDSKHDKAHAMELAAEIGNVRGGADLLESFYCQQDTCNTDYGLGDSCKTLPPSPYDLEFSMEKTEQVTFS